MRSLESYRGRDFVGVDELASVAGSLVERYRGEPDRGNVRLMITQRIVRHYMAEGLLGDPSGQSGTSIVFNYGNLLRLLAVKILLADRWSVVKIREFMIALDITALEQLINGAFSRSSTGHQQRTQESIPGRISAPNARVAQRRTSDSDQPRPPASAALASHNQTPLASLVIASANRAGRKGVEWIEIATGLEIKVRRSFRSPRTEQERERLIGRFLAVIDKKKGE